MYCWLPVRLVWISLFCKKKFICHTADSKPVKREVNGEVNGAVILPTLVFPGSNLTDKKRVPASHHKAIDLGKGLVMVDQPNLTQTRNSVDTMAKRTHVWRPRWSQSGSSRNWKVSRSPTAPQRRMRASRTPFSQCSEGKKSKSSRQCFDAIP